MEMYCTTSFPPESMLSKLQTSLNLSLARALYVYGKHTVLLADTGVPPLNLIQYTHLAQLHLGLRKTHSDTLPVTLFKTFNKPLTLNNLHPSTLDYHILNSLHQLHIHPLVDPLPHMTTLPQKCCERAYRNILRTTISTLWRMELLNLAPPHLPHNNCRKVSYIHIARDDLQRRDHTLLHCPHSSPVSHPAVLSLTRALRRYDLCTWSSHTPLQQTSFLLGSRPPKLLLKHDKAWTDSTSTKFTQLIYSLQSHFSKHLSSSSPGPA